MAYSYGEPTPVVNYPLTHNHGGFPYSFWGGTSLGGPGSGMYGPMGFAPGMRRGWFGPPSMMGGGMPMRYTRFAGEKANSLTTLEIFPALRNLTQAARDYEALDRSNLIQKGKRKYELKRIPALKGTIKGVWHYLQEPTISLVNTIKERKLDIDLEEGKISHNGYHFAILNKKTKNLKRGFKWGLEGSGYASHLVEKLGYLNACYKDDELGYDEYEVTFDQMLEDLKDFKEMKAITETEYNATLAQLNENKAHRRSLSR